MRLHYNWAQGRVPRRSRYGMSTKSNSQLHAALVGPCDSIAGVGRHADFSQIPSLRKKYKSHRRSELIRLGLCDEQVARKRSSWGSISHARLKSPAVGTAELAADESAMNVDEGEQEFDVCSSDEDDEGVLPSAAVACAEAMIAVAADAADEDACVS